MDLMQFSARNRRRCEASTGFGHPLKSWSLSDWMTATAGELGEAANIVKKLNRYRDGIPGNDETEPALRGKLADELADTFIYLDLLAQAAGIDLGAAVEAKFARTSEKIGYRDGVRPSNCREAQRQRGEPYPGGSRCDYCGPYGAVRGCPFDRGAF